MTSLKLFAIGLSMAAASLAQVIVNPAAFEATRPLAPQSVAAAFGEFDQVTPANANTLPLPNLLGGVEVQVGGLPAGIYSVTRTQVNFMIPAGVAASPYAKRLPVEIRINGRRPDAPSFVLVQDVSPAILVRDAGDALRPAIAVNGGGLQNAPATPAHADEVIALYVTGFGNAVADQTAPERNTANLPAVFFRGWQAETIRSTPAAGQPGVYLVHVRIPRVTEPSGSGTRASNPLSGAVPVTVLLNGAHSNTATVWLQ